MALHNFGEILTSALEELEELYEPDRFFTAIVCRKIDQLGIELGTDQIRQVETQVATFLSRNQGLTSATRFRVSIDDGVSTEATSSIKITQDDWDIALGTLDEYVSEQTISMLEGFAEVLLEKWKKISAQALRDERRHDRTIRNEVKTSWGDALCKLEMLISICAAAGENFTEQYDTHRDTSYSITRSVLIPIHARGIQVASEALTLMNHGFADGADARWRTLHELAAIATFIFEQGDEVAERYILHEGIDYLETLKSHQRYHEKLGWPPVPEQELLNAQETANALKSRFGKSFENDYGWASEALNKHRPSLFDIEETIGLAHFRPHFKNASQNIHASSSRNIFRLSTPPNEFIFLAGPSKYGLGQPGFSLAVSLKMLTGALLTSVPSFENLITSYAIVNLAHEVCADFNAAEANVYGSPAESN